MTSSVNSSRSTSPIPMGDHADDAPEGQSAAGSSSMPSQPASGPHPSTLSVRQRGSDAFLASQRERPARFAWVVDRDPNAVSNNGNTPLVQAVKTGNISRFKRLLKDDRVDVNKPDKDLNSPLLLACMGTSPFGIGDLKAKFIRNELLNKTGIDVNAANIDGITPLHAACRENALGAVEALLKADGINVNAKDNNEKTPLDFAFEAGNEEIMTALFKHGEVKVHDTDHENRTLLHRLLDNRFMKAIPALLTLAPDLASKSDFFGITPLHQAATMGVTDIVCALLEQEGVDLNPTDAQGRTPLHLAVSEGHIDTAKTLVENERVNINATDEDGYTPLHFAAEANGVEIGELLLARGDLDFSLKSGKGLTAFHMAIDLSPELATAMLKVPYELDENGMLAENALRPDDANINRFTPLIAVLNRAKVTNDFDQLLLFKELLNDPRVDSNQLLSPLRLRSTQNWSTVLDNLASLGFDRSLDSLLEVLHQWANKRPVGVQQNQALAAKTNFYLGQLYRLGEARREGLSNEEKLEFQSKAVFHYALALEQLLKHPEQSERRMTADHTEALDGIDSISNYARTLLAAVSGEDQLRLTAKAPPAHAIWSQRTEPFPLRDPEKHTGDQPVPTFELTEYIITDDVAPTDAVNIGGFCVPLADIRNLANGRGHKATQLALLVDDVDPRLRNAHQMGHLMIGAKMLEAVRNKNAETLARLNDASSSVAEAQPHAVPAFEVAVEQVRAAIARTHKRRPLNDTNPEVTQARLAQLADARAAIDQLANMPANVVVNERELFTTVQDVFCEMWFYIQNSPDEMRKNLEEALFDQLADMWDKDFRNPVFVCATGRVQRLLSVPHHIDPSLMTSTLNLSPQEMTSALQELARDVLRPIRVASHLAGIPETVEEDEPAADNAEILKVMADARLDVERDIFEATAREVMIGFRGWEDSPKVREAIETAKANIEYISMVTEDTQEA